MNNQRFGNRPRGQFNPRHPRNQHHNQHSGCGNPPRYDFQGGHPPPRPSHYTPEHLAAYQQPHNAPHLYNQPAHASHHYNPPPHNTSHQYNPPTLSQSSSSAPVQITLTVDPQQLIPQAQQYCPPQPYHPPHSQSFYNQPQGTANNPSRPLSPPPPYVSGPPPYQGQNQQNVSANRHRNEAFNSRRQNNASSNNFNNQRGRGRGRGNFRGQRGGNRPMHDMLNDLESIGLHSEFDESDDDDRLSVQSMPTRGNKSGRGQNKGYRGSHRGGHGKSGKKDAQIPAVNPKQGFQDNPDVCSIDNSVKKCSQKDKNRQWKNKSSEFPKEKDQTVQELLDHRKFDKQKPNEQEKSFKNSTDRRGKNSSCKGRSNFKEGIHEQKEIDCLKVSLKINNLFDDAEELKRTIREAFNFPITNHFDLKFTTEALIFGSKFATCNFLIYTDNTFIAKRCVKSMVAVLRKKLMTFVGYHMTDGKENSKKNSAQGSKEKCDPGKQVETDSASLKKPIKVEETADDNSSNKTKVPKKEKEQTLPCPVILNLEVHKTFAKLDGFKIFVEILVSDLSNIEEFELKNGSIVLSKEWSKCSILLKSKADAKRMKKTLSKFEKESHTEMKFEVVKACQNTEQDECNLVT